MNRELKFRFWGKFGELNEEDDECEMEMLYGNRFCFFENEPINDLFDCRNFQVMQYTGLKDKNGKEIYEGDILYNNFNAKGIVKFINGMFVVYFEYEESVCSKDNDKMTTRLISVNSITRIIGNIYENPELLKNTHYVKEN